MSRIGQLGHTAKGQTMAKNFATWTLESVSTGVGVGGGSEEKEKVFLPRTCFGLQWKFPEVFPSWKVTRFFT